MSRDSSLSRVRPPHGRMAPNPESSQSVNEVTQLLQEWESLPRDGLDAEGERIIAILEKLADIVERETDNFFKQVRIFIGLLSSGSGKL